MKILIAGASGLTGKEILSKLSTSENDIFGLIKNPDKKSLIEELNAMPIIANLEDEVSDLAKGMDAVIFVVGTRSQPIEKANEKAKYVDYLGLTKLVASCVKHRVLRFLYISSLNIGKTKKEYIQQAKDYYKNKGEKEPNELLDILSHDDYSYYLKMKTLAEEEIKRSDLNYTILRAGLLTNEKGTNKVDVYPDKIDQFEKTSRQNISKCFIEILNKENTFRKTYTIFDGKTSIDQAF